MGKRTWNPITILFTVGALVIAVAGGILASICGFDGLEPLHIMNISFDLLGMTMMVFILASSIWDIELPDDKTSHFFCAIILEETWVLFLDASSWLSLSTKIGFTQSEYFVNTLYYLMNIVMCTTFWSFVNHSERLDLKKKYMGLGTVDMIIHTIAIGGMIPIIVNLFVPVYFTVDQNGVYQRTPYYPFSLVFPAILMMITAIGVTKSKGNLHRKCMFYLYMLIPVAFAVIQIFVRGVSFLNVGILISILFLYTNIYSQRGREIAERNELLVKQNFQIMVSQVQPHFIYNTLGTIRGLCKVNPDLAGKTTENFAKYLRTHLDESSSLEHSITSINREIENSRVYSDIEEVRFPGVKVIYDIQDTEFDVPVFSIQPMVENSIKHGIRNLKEGRVWVKTYREDNFHVVEIKDNGVGIEVTQKDMDMSRSHIGIQNVKSRVEEMSKGSFAIESAPNEGTTIIMKFPVTYK